MMNAPEQQSVLSLVQTLMIPVLAVLLVAYLHWGWTRIKNDK